MDATTLRTKSAQALEKEMEESQARLQELRYKLSSNQLKGVREIKRTIARIQTLQLESKQQESNKAE